MMSFGGPYFFQSLSCEATNVNLDVAIPSPTIVSSSKITAIARLAYRRLSRFECARSNGLAIAVNCLARATRCSTGALVMAAPRTTISRRPCWTRHAGGRSSLKAAWSSRATELYGLNNPMMVSINSQAPSRCAAGIGPVLLGYSSTPRGPDGSTRYTRPSGRRATLPSVAMSPLQSSAVPA
jgi:hypothetical protein